MGKVFQQRELEGAGRGVPQARVRIGNERAVLTLITMMPGSSNADLARHSGLGPQTTSRIVADLEERGLIMRGHVLRGRRGQPATPFFLNPDGAYSIGIEIGWRHLQVALVNLTGEVLASERRPHDFPDASTVFDDIAAIVAAMVKGLTPAQGQRLQGVGIASPTSIGGNVDFFANRPDQGTPWLSIDIRARIAADTGLNAEWFNDGTAACWADIITQAAPRPTGFAYFNVGAYVGAGIIADGRIWEGPTGNAANLGAIMVPDRHGQPSFVHHVASISAFEKWLREAGQEPPQGSPQDWDWDALEPHATSWLDDAARALALAAMSTQAIVELDRVSIDGIMPRPVVERLLDRVQHHLALLPMLRAGHPTVTIGLLGAAAAVNGAATLPLYKRYFSRAWSDFDA